MNLMTPEIFTYLLHATPPHRGFKFQPREADGYIALTIFLDNFAEFSEPQRQDLGLWLVGLSKGVWENFGVPCYIDGDEEYKRRALN